MSADSGRESEYPVEAAANLAPSTPLPGSLIAAVSQDSAVPAVTKESATGILHQDFERLLDGLRSTDPGVVEPSGFGASCPRQHSSARGIRHLRTEHGEGHSDFFKVSDALCLSVINATYRKNTWIHFDGAGFFKLRLLLNGTLLEKSGDRLVSAPEASLHIAAAGHRVGDYLAANEHTRMVVLYCRPELLTHVIGLHPSEVPPPFDRLFANGQAGEHMEPMAGFSVMQTAQLIVESSHQIRLALRGPYLESLSMQILLQILREFDTCHASQRDLSSLPTRDLNRIYVARDHIKKNFASPPSIRELARRVGMNQTKLKGAFREVTGMTIYEYILRCRMERATILLQTQEYSVAEVAYQVGYTYPANFTHAFKKFHGALPRTLIPARRIRSDAFGR